MRADADLEINCKKTCIEMTTAWDTSHLVQLPIGMQVYPEGMSSQQADYACAEDASLSRTLAAVLSLPVCESASSIKNGSSSESKFWPPKSFTDSGNFLSGIFLHNVCLAAVKCSATEV